MTDVSDAKLEHRISKDGEVTIVGITGRMDAVRVGAVREALAKLPEQGHKKIVLDLTELEWIDSSGVGALVVLYKNAKARGGEVLVASLQRQPREIFRLLHLDSAFELFDAVPQALARFGVAKQP